MRYSQQLPLDSRVSGNDILKILFYYIVIPGKAQRRPGIQEFFYKASPKSSKGNHLGNDRLSLNSSFCHSGQSAVKNRKLPLDSHVRGNDIHKPLILFFVIPGAVNRRPGIQECFYKVGLQTTFDSEFG